MDGNIEIRVPRRTQPSSSARVCIVSDMAVATLYTDVYFVPNGSDYFIADRSATIVEVLGGQVVLTDWNGISNYAKLNKNLWLYGLNERIVSMAVEDCIAVITNILIEGGKSWSYVKSLSIKLLELSFAYASMASTWLSTKSRSVPRKSKDRSNRKALDDYNLWISDLSNILQTQPFLDGIYLRSDSSGNVFDTSIFDVLMFREIKTYNITWTTSSVVDTATGRQIFPAGSICTASRTISNELAAVKEESIILAADQVPVLQENGMIAVQWTILTLSIKVDPKSGWKRLADLHAANVFFHIGKKLQSHLEQHVASNSVDAKLSDCVIELMLMTGVRYRNAQLNPISMGGFDALWDAIFLKCINNRIPIEWLFRVTEQSFLSWAAGGYKVLNPLLASGKPQYLGSYMADNVGNRVSSRISSRTNVDMGAYSRLALIQSHTAVEI